MSELPLPSPRMLSARSSASDRIACSARVGCGGRGLRRGSPAGSRLARAQQAIAQIGLLLGRRVPLRRIGQVVQRAQAEELEEERRRAVQDGAELRTPALL